LLCIGAAELYASQNRNDLAQEELAQVAVMERYLPKQLTADEIKAAVKAIIEEVGAASPQEFGKVMGLASKRLAGKAEGKTISAIAKELLS
ncbi:MAG: GatB/YqeY domain-containing protein, partial [Bacteroidaceae bacterium]|nr:GatB/YqeY domain-containing protein [Bacteroidaceae bacterium]